MPLARLLPCGGTGSSPPDSSKPRVRRSWQAAILRGPISMRSATWPWFPRIWRGKCGASRPPVWENRSGTEILPGVRLSAWWPTSTIMACRRSRPRSPYWPALMDNFWGSTRVQRGGAFLIRTNRAATESFLTEATRAIWSVDSSLPVFQMRTLQDLYNQSLARTSFTLVLLAIAGAMALVLGIIGIYGVIAYAVTQRTREIGIRMALGAQSARLRRMFVRHGLMLAGIGAIIGLGAAAGLTRLMSSLLFGVKALDPLTYAGVAVILVAAAALASYIPARRATAVDPLDALRAE